MTDLFPLPPFPPVPPLPKLDPDAIAKAWYLSKTIWLNVVVVAGWILANQNLLPSLGIPAEYVVVIVAVANILVRFKTVDAVRLRG